MASRGKNRGKGRNAFALNPTDAIERYFKRGDYKEALKTAKVAFRQAPTDEIRKLLEMAHVGRAEELSRQGQREPARNVAESLLELGVTDLSVREALPALLVSLGMTNRLPKEYLESAHGTADLQLRIADQAVLRPTESPDSLPAIRLDALKVRAALDLIHNGDEAGAIEKLSDIPRHSPLADWKLFARGLAAYYRHDAETMLANWDRLQPNRLAARIAEPLKVLAGVEASDQHEQGTRSAIRKLESAAPDGPLSAQLTMLQRAVNEKDFGIALRAIRAISSHLRQLDPTLLSRLITWFGTQLTNDGCVEEIKQLALIADPPLLDPRWNLALAKATRVAEDGCFDDEEKYWLKYLTDLDQLSTVSPDERQLAQGLVSFHLAARYLEQSQNLRDCICGQSHDEEVSKAERDAVTFAEKCLQCIPNHRPAFLTLATFYLDRDRPEDAATTYRRALEQIPDDFDALHFLTTHHLTRDEPLEAMKYAERARQLKPLDESTKKLLWSAHVAAARHYALAREFDRGRTEFQIAERLDPASRDNCHLLVRKVALEIKANECAQARSLIATAHEKLEDLTTFWLGLTIESARYELPEEEIQHYENRWLESLQRKVDGTAAARMCELLTAHGAMQHEYAAASRHRELLLKYVRRCSRVKWQADELRRVCRFLQEFGDANLLKKHVEKGRCKFPEEAYFHWMAGRAEFDRGPVRCNRRVAKQSLQRALELARQSSDAIDAIIVTDAKHVLTILEESRPEEFLSPELLENDVLPDLDDLLDGPPTRERISNMLQVVCERLGLDPEQMLRDIEAGAPFQDHSSQNRRRRN